MRYLSAFADLRELDLNKTAVTAAGIGQIAQCGQLQTLRLQIPDLTPEAIEQLGSLQQLRVLDLRASAVADRAVAELQQRLPGCKVQGPWQSPPA